MQVILSSNPGFGNYICRGGRGPNFLGFFISLLIIVSTLFYLLPSPVSLYFISFRLLAGKKKKKKKEKLTSWLPSSDGVPGCLQVDVPRLSVHPILSL